MVQICKKHSQVRLTSVLVMNELFIRSHTFRTQLVKRPTFDTFLENVGLIGDHGHEKLPPPKDVAKLLLKKAIEVTKSWNDKIWLLVTHCCLMQWHLWLKMVLISINLKSWIQMKLQGWEFKRKRERKKIERSWLKLFNNLTSWRQTSSQTWFRLNNCFKLIYPDSFHASRSGVSHATISNGSETTVPNGSKATVPNGSKATVPNGSKATVPNGSGIAARIRMRNSFQQSLNPPKVSK